jgi:hypothetical protein
MRLRTFFLFGILASSIFSNCNDDDVTKGVIDISGITELDSQASNIGKTDKTDWNFTDTWSMSEENLFRKNESSIKGTEINRPNSSVVVTGYPNPAKDFITFVFQLEPTMYYDLKIVDENLNVKLSLDSVTLTRIFIKDSTYLNNQLYRMYYKIYSDNKVFRGHGDFKFIKQ